VLVVQSDYFQFGLEKGEWTSSTAPLLRSEDVFNNDVSNEGNDNEQSANAYVCGRMSQFISR